MQQDLSARLCRLRKAQGLSQEELAGIVGVSRQAVQKWESGGARPDVDNLAALSDYFGVSLDYLVRGVGASDLPAFPEELPPPSGQDGGAELWHYEYQSARTLWGLPLVHINLGRDGRRRARGVIAVGNSAVGLVAVGYTALGLFSVGLCAVGAVTLALMGVGLLLCLGGLAVGGAAAGGLAVGYLAVGGLAMGGYALGGCAVGVHIAAGGLAVGRIAIGAHPEGEVVFRVGRGLPDLSQTILRTILRQYPRLPRWLAALFAWVRPR